jgi:hypothetical protein
MRRFGRWIFNAAAVVSLVLCLGALAAWAASNFRCATVARCETSPAEATFNPFTRLYPIQTDVFIAGIYPGQVVLCWATWDTQAPPPQRGVWQLSRTWPVPFFRKLSDHPDRAWQYPGLAVARWAVRYDNYYYRTKCVFASYWLLSVLAALCPLWRLCQILRPRYRAGGCAACGYNLTGNVSGICPECGTAVVSVGQGAE